MFATFLFLFNVVVGYLVGSICSAVIVCRIFDLPDPRIEGSRNPGATNVLRLAGKQYALIVLLADMLKGLLPVLLARELDAGPIIVGFTCLATVIGHMYPVYFDFKGGKGVATALGALLGFHFILGVMVIATWLIVAQLTRYSSVASIISMILAPFYSLYAVGNVTAFLPLSIIALAILYQHRENITRLQDGKESKIKFRKVQNKNEEAQLIIPPQSPLEIKAARKTSKIGLKKVTKPTKKITAKTSSSTAVKPAKAKKAAPKTKAVTKTKAIAKTKAVAKMKATTKAKVAPKK